MHVFELVVAEEGQIVLVGDEIFKLEMVEDDVTLKAIGGDFKLP